MSVLSDRTLRRRLAEGSLGIDPLEDDQIQPASVDLRLASEFSVFREYEASFIYGMIDPRHPQDAKMEAYDVEIGGSFRLNPGQFALGCTLERVRIPADLVGRLDGRSSLARLGLIVHITAGNIDPGFEGSITLEFYNAAPLPFLLWPGMRVCHLQLSELDQPCERPYGHPGLGSKYQGQAGATTSKYWENSK